LVAKECLLSSLAHDWDDEVVILSPFIGVVKIFLFAQRVDSIIENEE
jgi:hypothetical protein